MTKRIRKSWFDEYDDKYKWLLEKCKITSDIDIKNFNCVQQEAIKYFLGKFEKPPKSHKIYNIIKILHNNQENYEELIDLYLSAIEKRDSHTVIKLTRGDKGYEKYITSIAEQNKKRTITPHSIEYWLDNGYNEKDAQYQRELWKEQFSNKISKGLKKRVYTNEVYNPYTAEFWKYRGYSSVEAEYMVENHKKKTNNSLENLILRHGKENGTHIYNNTKVKVRKTMMKKYGKNSALMPYTSKSSLRFFIPLYKKLRKYGFERNDICWGIKGSKEFVLNKDKIYFYDFTIKSIKTTVEFHGCFWHPKESIVDDWRNPFFPDCKKKYDEDNKKINLLKEEGFDVIIVFDDEDLPQKTQEIYEYIIDKQRMG